MKEQLLKGRKQRLADRADALIDPIHSVVHCSSLSYRCCCCCWNLLNSPRFTINPQRGNRYDFAFLKLKLVPTLSNPYKVSRILCSLYSPLFFAFLALFVSLQHLPFYPHTICHRLINYAPPSLSHTRIVSPARKSSSLSLSLHIPLSYTGSRLNQSEEGRKEGR